MNITSLLIFQFVCLYFVTFINCSSNKFEEQRYINFSPCIFLAILQNVFFSHEFYELTPLTNAALAKLQNSIPDLDIVPEPKSLNETVTARLLNEELLSLSNQIPDLRIKNVSNEYYAQRLVLKQIL